MKEEELEVLEGLGLASTRARVYLALCRSGISDVETISDITGIARQDIYRIASDLIELGLIETVISRPISYRATPIEDGTSLLLRQRQEELSTLELKTKDLLQNFTPNNKKVEREKTISAQFFLVPSKEALISRLNGAIEKTQTSIDVSTSWKRFKFACYRLADNLEKAWQRDVKGRVIIEKPEEPILDFVKICWKSPNARIKYVQSPPKTVMAIYDKREVFIYVEPTADLTESPALWSNNPSVVTMAADCFEIQWMTALEKPEYHVNGEQL